MKIAYVSHTRFPNEKAHGHQMARVTEAMTMLGHSVTLVSPGVHNAVQKDPAKYYHLQKPFTVERLPTFDALHSKVPGILAIHVTMRSYRKALTRYFASNKFDLLYARSAHVLPALLATKKPVILELHTLPRRGKQKFVTQCNACKKVVCLTSTMRKELESWGVKRSKLLVEGDAVDLERFAKLPSVKKAKHHFHVPEDIPVAGYVGSLVTMDKLSKGVEVLIEAAAKVRKTEKKFFVFVVGGPESRIDMLRKQAIDAGLTDHDFLFYGPVPPKLVPEAITACDVCVYPAPAKKHPFFLRDTSPLKLFEYAAAGKPIVCADLPPVRDVFSKETVRFVEPGSAASLIGGITDVLTKKADAKKRATKAKARMKNHTWKKRMERILKK